MSKKEDVEKFSPTGIHEDWTGQQSLIREYLFQLSRTELLQVVRSRQDVVDFLTEKGYEVGQFTEWMETDRARRGRLLTRRTSPGPSVTLEEVPALHTTDTTTSTVESRITNKLWAFAVSFARTVADAAVPTDTSTSTSTTVRPASPSQPRGAVGKCT